jgi:hypothetical protein
VSAWDKRWTIAFFPFFSFSINQTIAFSHTIEKSQNCPRVSLCQPPSTNQRSSPHTPFTSRMQPEAASTTQHTTIQSRDQQSRHAPERPQHVSAMSSSSSYGSYAQDKGYTSRPSTSSTSMLLPHPTPELCLTNPSLLRRFIKPIHRLG